MTNLPGWRDDTKRFPRQEVLLSRGAERPEFAARPLIDFGRNGKSMPALASTPAARALRSDINGYFPRQSVIPQAVALPVGTASARGAFLDRSPRHVELPAQ